jgi:TolB-like protein
VFDLLVCLIENRNRVVTRNELLEELWSGRVVSDSTLSASVKSARRAIGDSGRAQKIIKTISGRGYQFIASVSESNQDINYEAHSQNTVFGNMPSIYIEAFECLPLDEETRTFSDEIRDQLFIRLSDRTGIRILEKMSGYNESQIITPDYVVRGRVHGIESTYRVNLSMNLPDTGENVWAEGFSGISADLISLVDNITDTVVSALRLQLSAFDGRRVTEKDESQLSVSDLLAKSAEYFYRINIDDLHHAILLSDRAMTEAPNNSMALAMRAYMGLVLASVVPRDQHNEDYKILSQMADRAIELNHRSDFAFYARGNLRLLISKDVPGAFEDAIRCLEISPSYVEGFDLMGSVLICKEDADQAIEVLQRAVNLSKRDPFFAYYLGRLALAQYLSGDSKGALVNINEALQLHTGVRIFHNIKASILVSQGEFIASREHSNLADKLARKPHMLDKLSKLPLPTKYVEKLYDSSNANQLGEIG